VALREREWSLSAAAREKLLREREDMCERGIKERERESECRVRDLERMCVESENKRSARYVCVCDVCVCYCNMCMCV